jgi:hypothetical protein
LHGNRIDTDADQQGKQCSAHEGTSPDNMVRGGPVGSSTTPTGRGARRDAVTHFGTYPMLMLLVAVGVIVTIVASRRR